MTMLEHNYVTEYIGDGKFYEDKLTKDKLNKNSIFCYVPVFCY